MSPASGSTTSPPTDVAPPFAASKAGSDVSGSVSRPQVPFNVAHAVAALLMNQIMPADSDVHSTDIASGGVGDRVVEAVHAFKTRPRVVGERAVGRHSLPGRHATTSHRKR